MINQNLIDRYEDVTKNFIYCDTALSERKQEILNLYKEHSILFGYCNKLNVDLWRPCDEIKRLITDTEKLLNDGTLDTCGSKLYDCIDIINKVMSNTEDQLSLVRTIRGESDSELELKKLDDYEARLVHDNEALKIFRRSISKFTDHI